MNALPNMHHVVIVGAGFGGMEVAHRLAGAAVKITIIDQCNYHLFQPLLYQAATASLAPSEIAWPIRHLVRKREEITTLLARVSGVDKGARRVLLSDGGVVGYDTLVLATGARHAYFGHDEWEASAPGLKTLVNATTIRGRILRSFEQAERETDMKVRAALLTFVIVGGGPTGVELAGTIAELAFEHLRGEFRVADPAQARIVLIEAGPRILPSFKESLAVYAHQALERMGVEIKLGNAVRNCSANGVQVGDEQLKANVILWAAGVRASAAGDWLGVPVDHAGRVRVLPDLSAREHPEIYVIGDTATIDAWHGKPVPGIAPAAKQQGRYVAAAIRSSLSRTASPGPFRYRHDGSLATIGKRCAIIDFGWIRLRGWIAWWTWGFAHIYFLIGMRSRIAVALSWLWIYATGNRSARLITHEE